MPILSYMAGILKAVIPPLIPWATSTLAAARITQPEDNDIVTVGKIAVSGTYRFECGLSFVLLHHYDNKYWPQGGPYFGPHTTYLEEGYSHQPATDRQALHIDCGYHGGHAPAFQPLLPSRRVQERMASFYTSCQMALRFYTQSECNPKWLDSYVRCQGWQGVGG